MRRLALSLAFALPLAGMVSAQSDMGTQQQIDTGKVVYDKYCSQCHGYDGDGEGYATSRVLPVPRDFTAGKYKFRTTPSGMLPTDADLIKVTERGESQQCQHDGFRREQPVCEDQRSENQQILRPLPRAHQPQPGRHDRAALGVVGVHLAL